MNNTEFKKNCEIARELKVIIKNTQKKFEPLRKQLVNYANEHDIEGKTNGINFQHRHSFNVEESAKLAEEKGIPIPNSLSLNITQERIKELKEKGILKEHEIEETVDGTKLREILENKGIQGYFTRSVAFLI